MKILLFITCALFSFNSFAQNFRKDVRPESVKADYMNEYQASQISKVDLLSALDDLGIRIFNCRLLPRFTKTYKLTVDLEEFVNGKMINTKNISTDEKNIYFYWVNDKQYFDYIDKIKLLARDADSVSVLTVDIMGNTYPIKLKKHFERKNQFYSWRRYSVTNWKLNTKVPMLIYSSSWYDKKFDTERSCGAVDLSADKASTKELIDNSPHYFMVSYKISE